MIKYHSLAIILFQPEIPPNTGNIIRLCANTGFDLHLIKPLGFPLNDSKLKRAGLDYHEYANIEIHDNWQACKEHFKNRRIVAIETMGKIFYNQFNYNQNDALLFGSETQGLPDYILKELDKDLILRLPMLPKQRSLNLSNSVAIVSYQAWQNINFLGGF